MKNKWLNKFLEENQKVVDAFKNNLLINNNNNNNNNIENIDNDENNSNEKN